MQFREYSFSRNGNEHGKRGRKKGKSQPLEKLLVRRKYWFPSACSNQMQLAVKIPPVPLLRNHLMLLCQVRDVNAHWIRGCHSHPEVGKPASEPHGPFCAASSGANSSTPEVFPQDTTSSDKRQTEYVIFVFTEVLRLPEIFTPSRYQGDKPVGFSLKWIPVIFAL